MIIIYAIKEEWSVGEIPFWLFGIILLFVPVLLSLLSIFFSRFFGNDSLTECVEYNLADNEFLPTYLGYFFLSVGISEDITMWVVYTVIFVFTFLSQTQYFNPMYLLFGYHYYHILTPQGTRIFVISKGKVLRNKNDISFSNLRRLNDTTYIESGK